MIFSRRMKLKPWVLALVLGCGPVAYVHQVTMECDDAIRDAQAANAEKYAPYWWTRAKQYEHMAREVAAHADFQGANRFGRLATEAARQARADAELAAKDPSKRPIDATKPVVEDKGSIAPAKDAP